MLSPADTVRVLAPCPRARCRSWARIVARREAPPTNAPVPTCAGSIGNSSFSGPTPSRWECSSLVWRSTSPRLLSEQAAASAQMATQAMLRMVIPLGDGSSDTPSRARRCQAADVLSGVATRIHLARADGDGEAVFLGRHGTVVVR